jgi:hypothetical protein
MYFCVRNFALLYNFTLPMHTCGANTMIGSVVMLYVYTEARFQLIIMWIRPHCFVQREREDPPSLEPVQGYVFPLALVPAMM